MKIEDEKFYSAWNIAKSEFLPGVNSPGGVTKFLKRNRDKYEIIVRHFGFIETRDGRGYRDKRFLVPGSELKKMVKDIKNGKS